MTYSEAEDESAEFEVVVNDEDQYSLWRADEPPPPGWRVIGARGVRQACLDYIGEHWTDMRPRTLRAVMSGAGFFQNLRSESSELQREL